MDRLIFEPQGSWGRCADSLMEPVMYWLQRSQYELPQRTHIWNNRKLSHAELVWLDTNQCVMVPGDSTAVSRKKWGFVPHFHMPRFGGWQRFTVLRPHTTVTPWYVGWQTADVCGISQIPLAASVRVLRGPHEACYFGVDADGAQVPLRQCGSGKIGVIHIYGDVPLL